VHTGFLRECQYFLCLPKHKYAALNLLNGGESQVGGSFGWWLEVSSNHPAFSGEDLVWSAVQWYMLDEFESRIKPKKVERWMAHIGNETSRLYESIDDLHRIYGDNTKVKFIKIEIEE
jgi:hypothetical protein